MKGVGEPCAGEPHARFDAAVGGVADQSPEPHGSLTPPADPVSASGVPPYVLFRTALDSGNLEWVRTLSAQMPHIGLADALRICLMMRDADPGVLDRAAVRWLGRFALEARGATIADIKRAAELLDLLQSEPEAAMEQLGQLCVRFATSTPAYGTTTSSG